MRHGSLFSGIGEFDLAAEWMGWENVFNCDIDPFCQKVLKYHFPNAQLYEDIKSTDFTSWRGKCDIITGGFPCQPFSAAGKRKGTEDKRYLWPQMLRVIREVQPRWVVGENVFGIVNWSDGLVFEQVQVDLEAEGYEVHTSVLPAVSVNAPHRRDRVWFVAHRKSDGCGSTDHKFRENDCVGERLVLQHPTEGRDEVRCEPERHNGIPADSECSKQGQDGYSNRTGNERRSSVQKENEGRQGQTVQYQRCGDIQSDQTGTASLGVGSSEQGELITGQRERESGGCCGETSADTPCLRSDRTQEFQDSKGQGGERRGCDADYDGTLRQGDGNKTFTDTLCNGQSRQKYGKEKSGRIAETCISNDWDNFPTQSVICGGDDGLPRRLDSITFPKWRIESIKCYGNAIVPQVALQIFKAIQEYENNLRS